MSLSRGLPDDFPCTKVCGFRFSYNLIYKAGTEGVDCSKPAYHDRWKIIQTMATYASAPFDKQEYERSVDVALISRYPLLRVTQASN